MCIYMSKMVLVTSFFAWLRLRLVRRVVPSVLQPLAFLVRGTFWALRPCWSSVGLLDRPLGYYIVRSPQLDERFSPGKYWSR